MKTILLYEEKTDARQIFREIVSSGENHELKFESLKKSIATKIIYFLVIL
jgi:hypothetical protein